MLNKTKKSQPAFQRFLILISIVILSSCTRDQLLPTPIVSQATLPTEIEQVNVPGSVASTAIQNPLDKPQFHPSEWITPATIIPATIPPDVTSTYPPDSPTTLPPDDWMSLPIIPSVSEFTREIYQDGVGMGRDPHAFSKIGDCQSISTYFLSYFDLPGYYELGNHTSLQDTIDWFSGSFSRESLAVKGGFNAAAILSPLRSDPEQCNPNENPIACEFRLHNPSIAIISLEEWWADHPENYETYMHQIIEYAIQQGVVPIIATKADNLEGNNLINQIIARLSQEYDIPLWNFWLAVQPLPNHGLITVDSSGALDMFHLTHSKGYYDYNNPIATQSGWSIRNLTALQALDAVRRGLVEQP
jgi:hypothetical protein